MHKCAMKHRPPNGARVARRGVQGGAVTRGCLLARFLCNAKRVVCKRIFNFGCGRRQRQQQPEEEEEEEWEEEEGENEEEGGTSMGPK